MKRILRGFLATVAFSIFGIGALCLGFFILPSIAMFVRNPHNRRRKSATAIQYSWIFFVGVMEFLHLIKVDINRTALQGLSGTVVVANHPSLIDVVILVSVLPSPICVIKGGIKKNFFMKWVVFNTYIASDQDAEEFIESCSEVLKEGYNLIIFPEGTRTQPNKESKLHRGAAYVALKANAPILPIRIDMSEHILSKKQKFYDVASKRVIYTIKTSEPIHSNFAASYSRTNVSKLTEMIKVNIGV